MGLRWFYFLAFGAFLSSCEKNITIPLDSTESEVVVDASIETGRYPLVVLTNSVGYFSQINADLLEKSFIHNADMVMSDGTSFVKLAEDSAGDPATGLYLYFYTFTNQSGSQLFSGEAGKSYSLSIQTRGKTFVAATTIPRPAKTLDSLWWTPATHTDDSTEVLVYAKLSDPKGLGDYSRYFTSVNSGPFLPGSTSVFDDQVTDGTVYSVQVDKGIDRNVTANFNQDDFFHHGDTVGVKFCDIDKATFDFWRTMEFNYQTIGNPFSTPVKVIGNVSGGALGYFGGYAVSYSSLVIPE